KGIAAGNVAQLPSASWRTPRIPARNGSSTTTDTMPAGPGSSLADGSGVASLSMPVRSASKGGTLASAAVSVPGQRPSEGNMGLETSTARRSPAAVAADHGGGLEQSLPDSPPEISSRPPGPAPG